MNTLTFKRFCFLALFAAAVVFLLRHFVVDIIQVTSGSMQPAVKVGRRYLLDKVTYHVRKPRKNDIVAFPSPVLENHMLLKRIIATEGDILEIRNKVVWVNALELNENFVYHSRNSEVLVGDNLGPLEIPESMVFVMGDNRDESEDSRDWKDSLTGEPIYFIAAHRIIGRLLSPDANRKIQMVH